jgi:hypothetical protein
MRQFFSFLILLLGSLTLQAQTSKDFTVPITATLNASPTGITLNWENPGNAGLLILRRTKGQGGNSWGVVLNVANSNFNSLIDNGVANGQTYEYVIQRSLNGLFAFGYAHVAVNAPAINTRGKILIFVDSTNADALGVELAQLKNDMRGDGWWPIAFKTGPSSTVQTVKSQIVDAYNADPVNVKSVLLIGDVPVPYSGNEAWDGHIPDHEGAWPADAFYADVNGVWTDNSVNNSVPNRAANRNVPGDGKFDQDTLPSPAELQVGRIDFRRLDPIAFGAANHVELYKRYLAKNHRWRTGEYDVANRALVDDNFGFFGGEAFAANGYRNAYPLVGEANIVQGDFFDDTENQSFLMGYGCGPGSYTSADGVGSSANFATDSVNIVFSNLFGSYFGDWDFESNPLMPSALASRGGILNCSWAGRPHHFYQALASGETIGYVMWETMNAKYNNGFYGSYGETGAHVSLLGDPTIRANVVKPATNLLVTAPSCNSVELNWTASAETVTGYHVYRALSQDGPYTRLTVNPIASTTYTDNSPVLDTLYYQVRAIKNVSNPGGGTYANNATGPIKQFVFTGAGGPTVTATGGALNCITPNLMLTADAGATPITFWDWSGPGNFSSTLQNPTVTSPGSYTVTATDANGCSSSASATVVGDYTAPSISVSVSNDITCVNTSATITVSNPGLSGCIISGPNGFFVQDFEATATQPGTYSITATSATNGCIGNAPVVINLNVTIPSIVASNAGAITCAEPSTELIATTNAPNASFVWSGPCANGATATCAGIYTVIVTNGDNGCTSSAGTIVEADLATPTISAQNAVITCDNPEVALVATWMPADATLQWTGPCVTPGIPALAACAGEYTVVATAADNGCTASATAFITEDTQAPLFFLPPVPPLTCANPCYTLLVPSLPGIEIYIGGQLTPPGTSVEICQPGLFVATIKSLSNGCTRDVEVDVVQDLTSPVANAGPDMMVSCGSPSTILDGSGSSSAATYLWSGPAGFTSDQQNPTVTTPGVYVLIVNSLANGCTAADQVVVTDDGSLPPVDASVSGELNCDNLFVELMSGNNDPNATFAWVGPNGFASSLANPPATDPGTYTVVVMVGACTATDAVQVIAAPALAATQIVGAFNCDGVVESCAMVSGGTAPYQYLWSNGSTNACATYSGGGTLTVTVTDAGGCSSENETTLVAPPTLAVSLDPVLANCINTLTEVCVESTGGTPPYTYEWSDGSTASCALTAIFGPIAVTVTDAAGCSETANTLVQAPASIVTTSVPTNESAPNANDGAIDLTVSGGLGQFVYLWSNGATTQDLGGLAGGVYTVTVTDVVSGCTSTTSATITTTVSTSEAAVFEHFQLSPNPTQGPAMLVLKLYESAALRVEIRDVAGRLIWEEESVDTDALNLSLDLSNNPAGMYTISVWAENQVFVRKLAVIR